MKLLSKFAVIALAVFAFSLTVFAEEGAGPGGEAFFKKLNLTAEQKDKIQDLRTQHKKEMIDLKAELEKARVDKQDIVRKGNIDRKSYLSAEEKLISIRNKMAMAAANHKMDVYALLTPEQKEKVSKIAGFLFDHPRMMRHAGEGFRGQMGKHFPMDRQGKDAGRNWNGPHMKKDQDSSKKAIPQPDTK